MSDDSEVFIDVGANEVGASEELFYVISGERTKRDGQSTTIKFEAKSGVAPVGDIAGILDVEKRLVRASWPRGSSQEIKKQLLGSLCKEFAQSADTLSMTFYSNSLEQDFLDVIAVFGEDAPVHFVCSENNGPFTEVSKQDALDIAYDIESGHPYTLRLEIKIGDVDTKHTQSIQVTEKTEASSELKHWTEISELINSSRFLEVINSFPDNDRESVIGLFLEFVSLHGDSDEWDAYLESLRGIDFHHFDSGFLEDRALVQSIGRRLKLDEVESVDSKTKIFEYFQAHHTTGYYYHGFNGVFEKEIAQKGFSTTDRLWDWEEMKKISTIGDRVGYGMLVGWGDINSKDTSFVSAVAVNAYAYACASPEWFSQFTGGGFHVPVEGNRKKAFYLRDYDLAKKNIHDFIEKASSRKEEDISARLAYPNLKLDEKTEILSFFEKYWKLLAAPESKPKLALIKKSAVFPSSRVETLQEYAESTRENIETLDIAETLHIIQNKTAVDIPIKINILKDDILVIDLPSYEKVHPEVAGL